MKDAKKKPAKKKAATKKTSTKKPAPKKTAVKKPPATKEVAVVEPEPPKDLVTQDLIVHYMKAFGLATSLNDTEKMQFVEIAKTYQLNPFKREIYAVPYMASRKDENGKWIKVRQLSIITGYETYIKRAERLNVLDGWNVRTEQPGGQDSLRAIITIYRKDWQYPFIHEVAFKEYNQENKIWKEKPLTMIKKVVTAQGFRLAFPDEFGGMPYTQDELPDDMTRDYKSYDSEKPKDDPVEKNESTSLPDITVPLILSEEEQAYKFDVYKKDIDKARSVQMLVVIGEDLKREVNSFDEDRRVSLRDLFGNKMSELKEALAAKENKEAS